MNYLVISISGLMVFIVISKCCYLCWEMNLFLSCLMLALAYRGHSMMRRQKFSVIYNKPTRCNSGSIVFIKNYKYALHVLDALSVHHQEHYKL